MNEVLVELFNWLGAWWIAVYAIIGLFNIGFFGGMMHCVANGFSLDDDVSTLIFLGGVLWPATLLMALGRRLWPIP